MHFFVKDVLIPCKYSPLEALQGEAVDTLYHLSWDLTIWMRLTEECIEECNAQCGYESI